MQLYFFSILCNVIAGFLFVQYGGFDGNSENGEQKPMPFSGGFVLVVGIIAAVTGILKLLAPIGDTPILGDLLPAAAGVVSGFMLMYGFYSRQTSLSQGENSGKSVHRIASMFLMHKKPVGIACFVVAVLHLIFPEALFL